jgi:hypothetical protein
MDKGDINLFKGYPGQQPGILPGWIPEEQGKNFRNFTKGTDFFLKASKNYKKVSDIPCLHQEIPKSVQRPERVSLRILPDSSNQGLSRHLIVERRSAATSSGP